MKSDDADSGRSHGKKQIVRTILQFGTELNTSYSPVSNSCSGFSIKYHPHAISLASTCHIHIFNMVLFRSWTDIYIYMDILQGLGCSTQHCVIF